MATIQGTLLYTCVQSPVLKYQDKVNKEFKVSVCVDEDTADAFNDAFPKQAAKVIKTSDFKDQYKVDAPFPDERKQYVITLKRDAQYQDGNPIDDKYKPKVFVRNEANGKLVDITKDKLVANGSVGVVSYEVRDTQYGPVAKLKNIRVDELIEYQQAGEGDDELGEVDDSTGDDDFDKDVQGSDSKADDKPAAKSSNKPAGKTTNRPAGKPKTGNAVADIDEDPPF